MDHESHMLMCVFMFKISQNTAAPICPRKKGKTACGVACGEEGHRCHVEAIHQGAPAFGRVAGAPQVEPMLAPRHLSEPVSPAI